MGCMHKCRMHACCMQAKAAAGGDAKGGPGGPEAPGQADKFGAKYEQHVSQLQRSLEEAQQRLEGMQKTSDELRCEAHARMHACSDA